MAVASSCQLSLCITANAFTADDISWEGVQSIFFCTREHNVEQTNIQEGKMGCRSEQSIAVVLKLRGIADS